MAVHFISTEGWSHEKWLQYRYQNGIGASVFGTLIGMNYHSCALKLFHEMIGLRKPIEPNFSMINGHWQEPIISKWWEYWEKDHDTMVKNVNAGRKQRIAVEVGGYMTNDKFPFMFASLDRKFRDDRYPNQWCALELKDPSAESYNMFENQNNPNEICQIAFQLLISESPYGELCHKIGNKKVEVKGAQYKDALRMEKMIVKEVSVFWDRVLNARKKQTQIWEAKNSYNMKLAEKLEYELLLLEPPAEKTLAYANYLSELSRTKSESIPMKGTNDLLDVAKQLKKISEKRKKMESEEIALKCQLFGEMHRENRTEISWGKEGSVSLFGGRFKNKVK